MVSPLSKPISGPAKPGVQRMAKPDPKSGARGSNHGILVQLRNFYRKKRDQ